MDDFFGPALKGVVSSQLSILAGGRQRVASRKPRISHKEVANDSQQDQLPVNIASPAPSSVEVGEDALVILSRPENLKLIAIPNRNAPDFCEVCGIGHGLFWTGKYVSCIDCARTLPKLRSMGIFIPERPKTPQEFLEWLSHQKYLMRRLFH